MAIVLVLICLASPVVLWPAGQAVAQETISPKLSALLDVVRDPDDVRNRRHRLTQLVSELGPETQAAVTVLRALLTTEDSHTRAGAALTLGLIGPTAADAVPALIALLNDEVGIVRFAAGEALRLLGPAAKAGVPALINTLAHDRQTVRNAAALALIRIDPELLISTARMLTDQLKDQAREVRQSAARSLGSIGLAMFSSGPASKVKTFTDIANPGLITALHDEDEGVRSAVASALGNVAQSMNNPLSIHFYKFSPKDAAQALIQALDDEADSVRAAAAGALGKIWALPEIVVPILIGALADPNAEVRAAAARALGKIGSETADAGPVGATAFPALIALIDDKDWRVRSSAAFALGSIKAAGNGVGSALARALRDSEPRVRQSAAFVFHYMARKAQSFHGPLTEGSFYELQERRREEVRAAIPTLIDALNDADKEVRRWVARTLYEFGPSADTVPALIDALNDESVRRLVIMTLGKIGPPAKAAVPTLIEMLHDDHPFVREAAAEALERIRTP